MPRNVADIFGPDRVSQELTYQDKSGNGVNVFLKK